MKPSYLLVGIIALLSINTFAQGDDGKDNPDKSLRTVVYRFDLNVPNDDSFKVVHGPSHNSLVVHNKRNLALILANGNPYRYNYKLNHSYLSLFKDEKNPFDTIGKVLRQARVEAAADTTARTLIEEGNEISQKIFTTLRDEAALAGILAPKAATKPEDLYKNNLTLLKVLIEAENQLRGELESYVSEISSEDHLDPDNFKANRAAFLTKQVDIKARFMELYSSVALSTPDKLEEFKERAKLLDEISKPVSAEINKMFTLKLDNYMIPINFDGENIDAIDITLERQDKQIANAPASITEYRVWVIGGLKIDISPGVFFTTIKDMEYETVDNPADSSKKMIYEKETGNLQLAVGSTLNVGFRSSGWVKPTFCAGVLLTQDQNIQIIAGGGFHFGKMERISLMGGISMGMRNEINSRYKADGKTEYDFGTNTEVPTNNVFKVGGFFGLTYNLGKVKKIEPEVVE